MSNNIKHVGMDVHKKNIVVAESSELGKGRFVGEYENTDGGLKKLMKQLKAMKKESEIKICYEAGPCGYALKRIFDKQGFVCEIVAPSLIPVKSGSRVKTDKRDAIKLATLYGANQLTFVSVPDEQKEAVRDLIRCREDLKSDIKRVKQRLNQFLLRRGYTYPGSNWTLSHMAWVRKIEFDDPCVRKTCEQYINQKELLEVQLAELDKEIEAIAQTDEYKDKVTALCAFKGIGLLSAMIILSEVVSFSRFQKAEELMSYLGMVPSEYSSGGHVSKGAITKTGNTRARRALIEAAWHYRHPAVITQRMRKSLEVIDAPLRLPPTKGLKRLNKKYHHLLFKGKMPQKAIVAVARELSGFIWDSMVTLEQAETQLLAA